MSFKYHCKPVITNAKGCIRLFDIAFSSYTGGGNTKLQSFMDDGYDMWKSKVESLDQAFGMQTASLVVMAFIDNKNSITSSMIDPVCLKSPESVQGGAANLCADAENIYSTYQPEMSEWQEQVLKADEIDDPDNDPFSNKNILGTYMKEMPDWTLLHAFRQTAGHAANQCDSHCNAFFFEGSYKTFGPGVTAKAIRGNGHLGHSVQGCSAVRSGKGLQMPNVAPVQLTHLV
jgi:hypothetical protein